MNRCPHCCNVNLVETEYRGITRCEDCGTEFRGDTVFKEGSYQDFVGGVLTKLSSVLEARAATVVNEMRLNMIREKNDVDVVVQKLMDIAETVNTDNVLGVDRKEDVIQIVESIDKIVKYAYVLAERNEIEERVAFRLKIMEGLDVPGLPPELDDPQAGPIVSADPAVGPSGFDDSGIAPGLETLPPPEANPPLNPEDTVNLPNDEQEPTPWQEGLWLGEKVKFCVEQDGDAVSYNVCRENGDPLISYNKDTKQHEGLEKYTEEQLEELDGIISEYNKSVMNSMADQYGADKAKEVYYATANKQGRDEETFKKNEEVSGPVISTADTDPANEAANITANAFKNKEENNMDLSSYKETQIYRQVEKNLRGQMKRGTFDECNALNAMKRVVKQSHVTMEGSCDVESAAKSLLDEFVQTVNGPIGSPAAQSEPSVDGPIGQPVVDENELGVPGADGEVEIEPENGSLESPIANEGEPVSEIEPEQSEEEKEHEEAEEAAIEDVQSAAEKAEDKLETAEKALEDLKAAVEALTDIEGEEKEEAGEAEGEAEVEDGECEGDDCEIEDGFDDGETEDPEQEDEIGDVEGEAETAQELKEFEEKKVGKHKFVAKPEIIPAKREATGEKPDGHIVKYVKTVHDPSKEPAEQWSEEEVKIPLTQEEAEKAEVDEEGKKKKNAGDKNKKEEYKKKDFEEGRPSINESTRFNGFRLGDKIKIPGYPKSFELSKIMLDPVRFVLTEGKVSITIDPNTDKFDLDEDKDIKWQRTTTILEDTRQVWEEMEKSMVNEGCAGGVCTIGGPMHVTNNTSGIGNVSSVVSSFIATPIRQISHAASDKEIYTYIKMNNLHNSPRQTAISHLLGNFQNAESNVEKILDDAIMSLKYDDSNPESINEVDKSYGFKTQCSRGINIQQQLEEGYEALKKQGIV
jgi:hypothetical protein